MGRDRKRRDKCDVTLVSLARRHILTQPIDLYWRKKSGFLMGAGALSGKNNKLCSDQRDEKAFCFLREV